MSAMTFLDFFFLGTSSFLLTSKGSHVRRRLLSILRSINKHPVRSGKMSPNCKARRTPSRILAQPVLRSHRALPNAASSMLAVPMLSSFYF